MKRSSDIMVHRHALSQITTIMNSALNKPMSYSPSGGRSPGGGVRFGGPTSPGGPIPQSFQGDDITNEDVDLLSFMLDDTRKRGDLTVSKNANGNC
jgi:hypothetical protein